MAAHPLYPLLHKAAEIKISAEAFTAESEQKMETLATDLEGKIANCKREHGRSLSEFRASIDSQVQGMVEIAQRDPSG